MKNLIIETSPELKSVFYLSLLLLVDFFFFVVTMVVLLLSDLMSFNIILCKHPLFRTILNWTCKNT